MAKIEFLYLSHFVAAKDFAKTMPAQSRYSFRYCLTVINRIKKNYKADRVVIG